MRPLIEMSVLQGLLFALVAIAGTVTVFARDKVKQALLVSFFGIALTLLFMTLKAPDVAFSELVIGAAVLPLMLLVAIARTDGGKSK